MRHNLKYLLTLVFALLLVSIAVAANPEFSPGFPKPGPAAGDIDCEGTIVLPVGGPETTHGNGILFAYPKNGGLVKAFPITIAKGKQGTVTWTAKPSGLVSMQEYTLIAGIDVVPGPKRMPSAWFAPPKNSPAK
jgi:hypothetical protein